MPAVTADSLTLPRITVLPEAGTAWRPVAKVVTAQVALEGEGFVVRRPFPSAELSMADPFLLLDQMGAVEYAPGRGEGHVVAPAPRLRDRDVHDRWRVRAPGHHRRRRPDHATARRSG